MGLIYDAEAVGKRIRERRKLLGYSQEELAEKIGRASKYYADIERGSCGMSVETLLSLGKALHVSLDYLVYGKEEKEEGEYSQESRALLELLNAGDGKRSDYAAKMLKLFLTACESS